MRKPKFLLLFVIIISLEVECVIGGGSGVSGGVINTREKLFLLYFLELNNNNDDISNVVIDMMKCNNEGIVNDDEVTFGFVYQSCMSCASLKHPLTSRQDANCNTMCASEGCSSSSTVGNGGSHRGR